jgi:transcriptional regulator with XRE-family HTH domain
MGLAFLHRIRDNSAMARKTQAEKSGLYHAREARRMSRTELVKRSGVSKQQLSRLENGQIRLRLDHLKPFAGPLGYTPEQMLLWGRFPGTGEAAEADSWESTKHQPVVHTADVAKAERWSFPKSFVTQQLHTTAAKLRVFEIEGDSMVPTIVSGDRVVIDTGHKNPSPDGLYAIRDAFDSVIVRRLQLLRSGGPSRVKVISDNPNHAAEEVSLSELKIVGKVVCCLRLV